MSLSDLIDFKGYLLFNDYDYEKIIDIVNILLKFIIPPSLMIVYQILLINV